MSGYVVDMEGRFRLTKKPPFLTPGYQAVGQKLADVKGIHKTVSLEKDKNYDVPLHPQQTVVQFNSTYLETIGRNERRRGDAVGWGLFLFFIIVSMTPFVYHISIQLNNDFNFFSLAVGVFGIASILVTYILLINMLNRPDFIGG